ncbi:MAG: phosphatase PAP2 family protein [Bryobacterales bacterium]|nr:phosphatase PAP2 family protein [Bryobacterales bacterium]
MDTAEGEEFMFRFRTCFSALAAAAVLGTGPAATAELTLKDHVESAKAALARKDLPAAAGELTAASKCLGDAAASALAPAKERLQALATEMSVLAEEVGEGAVTDLQRIEETSARAQQALAGAPGPNHTSPPQAASLRTLFRDLGGDFKHLPSLDSLLIASAGGGAALAVHPADSGFNQRLENDGGLFKMGDFLGNAGTLMGASTAAYLLGRATGKSHVARVGLDLLRAQIVTEAMVEPLKYTVRRPRPDGSGGYAFPSGHAAMTFATAAVIERHHGWRWALPVYGLAAYVAMSRLHDNVHSLSDVVFGAAVGTVAGRTVVRDGRPHAVLLPFGLPGGWGVALVHTW